MFSTGGQRWAKLNELNFFVGKTYLLIDGQTRWAKLSSQLVNLPGPS